MEQYTLDELEKVKESIECRNKEKGFGFSISIDTNHKNLTWERDKIYHLRYKTDEAGVKVVIRVSINERKSELCCNGQSFEYNLFNEKIRNKNCDKDIIESLVLGILAKWDNYYEGY